MADKDKRRDMPGASETGHTYENRQEIYYNDNVGGRAVFVDAKEQYDPDEPYNEQVYLPEKDRDKEPILQVNGLGIDFGGLTAVDNFNLTRRTYRTERSRQNNDIQHAHQGVRAYKR